MPSPFPGMDPYIEARQRWADFHHEFIGSCRAALNGVLPEDYIATIDERLQLLSEEERGGKAALPDVSVVHDPDGRPGLHRRAAGPVATAEPHVLTQATEWLDQPKESFIEVRHLPDENLVTSVEVLSPSNKREPGRSEFLYKRQDLLRREVNLVEVDLLLGGERLPMLEPLPPGDYYVFVTRTGRPDKCAVYAWDVRRPLPPVPVPLRAGDGDVQLDLAAVFAEVYERGRYHRQVDYRGAVPPLLGEGDRPWAAELARPLAEERARRRGEA
jgi:hypothetical protein